MTTAAPIATPTKPAYEALAARLDARRLQRNEPLAQYTTFRIGGPADLFYTATSADDLATALQAARELGVPHFVLGLGANILIGDRGYRGLVIRNCARHFEFQPDGRLWVESGAVMQDLVLEAVERGWSGLEHFIGIPSTVGGAIWQNLHFLSPPPERERTVFVEEVVESARILSAEGKIEEVDRDYFRFGYDYSILHDRDDVVLSVVFALEGTPEQELRDTVRENLQWRDDRHPDLWLYPSAGSVFQKIEGVGAGRLIDQCGLKGHVHGNAQIFHKHANIVVNLGGATAADVRGIIDLAQRTVKEELGYELETEIGFIGEF